MACSGQVGSDHGDGGDGGAPVRLCAGLELTEHRQRALGEAVGVLGRRWCCCGDGEVARPAGDWQRRWRRAALLLRALPATKEKAKCENGGAAECGRVLG